MKYKATITGLGECALDFLDECCNFIIIFNEDAPPELADISVLHTKSEVKEDPKKGDTVRICGAEYTIADVGWEALNTLKGAWSLYAVLQGSGYSGTPGYY